MNNVDVCFRYFGSHTLGCHKFEHTENYREVNRQHTDRTTLISFGDGYEYLHPLS